MSAWGEEGPPCAPTSIVTLDPDDTVTLNTIPGAPTGNYNIAYVRIYRTITGGTETTYQYVGQVTVGTSTYTDSATDEQLTGVSLASLTWEPPPDDMHSVVQLAGGMTVGASKNQVCPSEPYLPHAYNSLSRQTTNHPIVGLGSYGNTLVAITEKNPYIAMGVTPDSLVLTEYTINQGCVSARSIRSNNGGVGFASPDGLIVISDAGVANLSEPYLDRDQWQALKPESILGATHDSRYIGFYDTGAETGAFVIDPASAAHGYVNLDIHADGAYSDPLSDALYLIVGNKLYRFDDDAANPLTYTWRSGIYLYRGYTTLTAARVLAESYQNITFNLYVDGALKHSESVASDRTFRMPAGYRGSEFEIELIGTDTVVRVDVASTVSEVAAA